MEILFILIFPTVKKLQSRNFSNVINTRLQADVQKLTKTNLP